MVKRGLEPSNIVYERLCETLIESGDSYFYRLFYDFLEHDFIVIRENNENISNGTTGLSCWQVGFFEYMYNKLF